MTDKEAIFNRASALVKEYKSDGNSEKLAEAMADCLEGYINWYNKNLEDLRKLDCVVDLCAKNLNVGGR